MEKIDRTIRGMARGSTIRDDNGRAAVPWAVAIACGLAELTDEERQKAVDQLAGVTSPKARVRQLNFSFEEEEV